MNESLISRTILSTVAVVVIAVTGTAFAGQTASDPAVELVYLKSKKGIDENGKLNGKINIVEECRIKIAGSQLIRDTTREVSFDFLNPSAPGEFVSSHVDFEVNGEVKQAVDATKPDAPRVTFHGNDVKILSRVSTDQSDQRVNADLIATLKSKIAVVTDESQVVPIPLPESEVLKKAIANSVYLTYWSVRINGKDYLIERNVQVSRADKAKLLAENPSYVFRVTGLGNTELKTWATDFSGQVPDTLLAAINYVDNVDSSACAAK